MSFTLPIPPNGMPVFNETKNGFSEPWQRYFLQLGVALRNIIGGADFEVLFNDAGSISGIDNGVAGDVLTSNGAAAAPSFAAVPNRFDQDLNTTDAVNFAAVTVAGLLTAVGLVVTSGTRLAASTQSFTNGAGAFAGTLLNAPAVGNPTKWIAVDDNGTTRHIPAW